MNIRSETVNGVCTIEIVRPDKKNAITGQMYSDLATQLNAAALDVSANSILIVGQPNIFTAGNDLEDFLSNPPENLDAPVFQFMRALIGCSKPVIACVRGAAVGIGTTMLLHCDFVFVAHDAHLAMPFVTLGIVPEFGSSYILPQMLGAAKAAEFLMLGTPIKGTLAAELGIATAALPTDEVLAHARAVAERFNALPTGAVRATKQLLRGPRQIQIKDSIEIEGTLFIERLKSVEAQQAFAGFLNKQSR